MEMIAMLGGLSQPGQTQPPTEVGLSTSTRTEPVVVVTPPQEDSSGLWKSAAVFGAGLVIGIFIGRASTR